MNRVVLGRLRIRFVVDQMSVIKDRETAANDGRRHRLLNHVVRQQNVVSVFSIVEDVQIVFAIDGCDPTLEQQIGQVIIECFVLPSLKVVTVTENQTVIFRQQDTGVSNRVDPSDRVRFLVKN